MSGQTESTPVGQIVLARLVVAGERGATGTDLKKALEPLLGHRWAGAALIERLGQELSTLESAGLVSRARKGRSERSTLTELGHRRALDSLGLDHLPPKTTWDKVKKSCLAARALGLPTPTGDLAKPFASENGFKAALIKALFALPLSTNPKLEDAIGALAWTLLGFEPGRKFDVKTVQVALLQRALGEETELAPQPDPKKATSKLLAREVGARASGKDELRLAVIRRWVDGEPVHRQRALSSTAVVPSIPKSVPPVAPAGPRLDLSEFARRVVHAARSSPSGRFGDNKVYIHHVWRALQGDAAIAGMGVEGFKRSLAEANNARLLDLGRADLVEAMDPEDVRLSEVGYLGGTFHFVRI